MSTPDGYVVGMDNLPARIWLQRDTHGEVTWCSERINDDDVEYVRAPASGEPSGADAVVREALRDCEEVLRLIHEAAGPVPKDAPMPRTTSWGAWKAAREALGLPTAPGAPEEGAGELTSDDR